MSLTTQIVAFMLSIAIGLLIGLEREPPALGHAHVTTAFANPT